MFAHFFIKSPGVRGWQAVGADSGYALDTFTWSATAEERMRFFFGKWKGETRISWVRCDLFDTDGTMKASIRQVADFL